MRSLEIRSRPEPVPPPPGGWSKAATDRTITSVPAFTSANRLVNVALSVSVRMKLPATNATPRTTASDVRARRTLWARSPFRVARHMGSAPQALHPVEHSVGGRPVHLVHDLAVGQEHDPVGEARGVRVVGDHHDGLAEVGHRLAEEPEQLGPGLRV